MNNQNPFLGGILGDQLPEVPVSITPKTAMLIYGGFFITFLAAMIVLKALK